MGQSNEEKLEVLKNVITNFKQELKDFKKMPVGKQLEQKELLINIENRIVYLEEKYKVLESDSDDDNAIIAHYEIV